ncbi:MAG TPA: LPXTG cell wall anchor domain-containing protein [Flavisolibacter sp.]|jgi:LPXTG-motif cell wall-anchored protein|nr:LPXTG cell wall anchor domain-containing protein [Flavisolibacter sp.]
MKKKNLVLLLLGAAVAAGATFLWLRKREGTTEKPPKKAPQLDLQNPGDQSEFMTAPGDSEIG